MVGKRTATDWVIDIIIWLIMIIVIVAVMYPFLNALAISLNHAEDTALGGITIFPRRFSLESYSTILTNPVIGRAYFITISRTLLGTLSALFVTGILAYGLAHSDLVGRKYYAIFLLIPMYFAGGIVPQFLMLRAMNMFNSFWVFVVPHMVGLFNVILMRTFFQQLPDSLEESAKLDGANYLQIFFRIIIPISTPIFATIALFVGVFHWNDWFWGNIYITNQALRPMQNILLSVINEAQRDAALAALGGAAARAAGGGTRPVNVRSITVATMFVTIAPIIAVYPFLQRFFIKGMMVGSIKG